MKKITSKITPFEAIIDGSNRYSLSDVAVLVPDNHAEFIRNRWGNLVDIEDATIEQIVDDSQTIIANPTAGSITLEPKVEETTIPSTE